MKRNMLMLGAAGALAVLLFTARAGAGPLLSANIDNTIKFADVENLYSASGTYLKGNAGPQKGDYLVSIFNITENTTNGWASIPVAAPGVRDTYTGVSVAVITGVSTSGGVTTVTLRAPTTGDVSTFTGGAFSDSSSFSVSSSLNYANHDTIAIYHQGDTAANAVLPVLSFNGNVGTDVSTATEGTKYLTLDNQATHSYMFASGTVPPTVGFALTSYEGLQPDFNNTGFSNFQQISDTNVNGGADTVPFYIESKINFNANGQFSNPQGKQHWDYQSSDPANILPQVVPEPTGLTLLAVGALGLFGGASLRRWRAFRRAA